MAQVIEEVALKDTKGVVVPSSRLRPSTYDITALKGATITGTNFQIWQGNLMLSSIVTPLISPKRIIVPIGQYRLVTVDDNTVISNIHLMGSTTSVLTISAQCSNDVVISVLRPDLISTVTRGSPIGIGSLQIDPGSGGPFPSGKINEKVYDSCSYYLMKLYSVSRLYLSLDVAGIMTDAIHFLYPKQITAEGYTIAVASNYPIRVGFWVAQAVTGYYSFKQDTWS